jgi:antitoxin (DNA-binding transcriptional repressor) of toxin-antitoxin stability system
MLLTTLVLELRDLAGRHAEILEELRKGREVILLSEGEPAGVIEPWFERDLGELRGSVLWSADDIDEPMWDAWGLKAPETE